MYMFFSTFFKILASLLAISVFFIILFSLLSLFKPNDKNTKFEFIKGNKDSKNLIAVIKLDGPIIRNTFGLSKITSIKTISPNKLKEDLSSLKKLKPKILIIQINSPGGTVTASYEAFDILKKFKEENNVKLYFHTNEALVSGAYWVALSGDKIFASYGSIIGSIGVKGPDWIYFDKPISMSSGLFGNSIETQNGIKVFSQNAGESKDLLNPFRKPTNDEINILQSNVNDVYEDFVNIVSKNRKIEINILKNEIGALIFNSDKAKINYLIDDVINLNSLIKRIVTNQKYEDYKIYEDLNQNFSIFEYFFLKLFKGIQLQEDLIFNNLMCIKFRNNISSINRNYLLNC